MNTQFVNYHVGGLYLTDASKSFGESKQNLYEVSYPKAAHGGGFHKTISLVIDKIHQFNNSRQTGNMWDSSN